MNTPPKIDLLPEHLIDQIKAGEVIERPGSLIKEILENAVDAGSTRLDIHIKNNGLDLISLKDNGHGMRMNDLPLAFSRHATSKISRFEDLYRLHSFGFRGEALASIAAIAKVQCLSFTDSDSEGSEIRIEGGMTVLHTTRKKENQRGTELVIQDLFFNTPARLKFIQSQQAEKKYIRSIIYSFVLSHPEIEFILKFDDEEKDLYPRVGTIEERVLSIIPKGKDRLLTQERHYENYSLKVLILPDVFKAPVSIRNIYINERYVLDKQLHRVLSQALISAFGNDDWHYLAFFTLPADSIDVNVHPNKTVIKFMENSKLISLLTSTVKELARPVQNQMPSIPRPAAPVGLPLGEVTENYQLLQERHDYNMDGLFSPHGLTEEKADLIWCGDFLLKKDPSRWSVIHPARLIASYVTEKLKAPATSIPLLVSEPYPLKGISETIVSDLNERGFEFERLGSDTLVMRAIPEWMNGLPLKDIVQALLMKQDLSKLVLHPPDWSSGTWDEMISHLGEPRLIQEKILSSLEEILRGKVPMKVVIISGPTASGKTSTAIDLALEFGGEVVNYDSLLLYKEITIGTAKPTQEERRQIPHHMIDVTSISAPMNASDYMRAALPVVEKLLKDQKIVYLVGGSGFYLQALLKGMYDSPTTPTDVLRRSELMYSNEGIKPFLEILRQHDPGSFSRYHENDHYRIRRAVEHWWANGTPFFEERNRKNSDNTVLPGGTIHGWDVFHAYLDLPKEEHLRIIEKRTDMMLETGLIEEVRSLLDQGFSGLEKPLQSIGYKEALDFIFGVYKTKSECRERIVISTRQLAKSQRTWFKKDDSRHVFHPVQEKEKIKADLRHFLESGKAL